MKIEQIEKECQGNCPVCGSDYLEYFSPADNDGETITYNFQCKDCQTEGWEWYILKYDFTTANIKKDEKLSSI